MTVKKAWLGGDLKHLRVLVRNESVDAAHYFTFPAERGRTKLDDVEPVQRGRLRLPGRSFTIMLSRLHYLGLVIWIDPKIHERDGSLRPLCRFALSVHTPCIDMGEKSKVWEKKDVADAEKTSGFQRAQFWLALRLFDLLYWITSDPSLKEYPNVFEEREGVGFESIQLFDRKSIVNQTRYLLFVCQDSDLNLVKEFTKTSPDSMEKRELEDFLLKLGIP